MSSNRRLVIALSISLALNVFAAGFVVARALHHRHDHGRMGAHGPLLGPRGLLEMQGGGEGAALMKRHGEAFRAERSELRKARRAVHDALKREPLDAAQLERAFSQLRERTSSSQARMHTAMIELAKTLPLDKRKKLAERARVLDLPDAEEPPPPPPPN